MKKFLICVACMLPLFAAYAQSDTSLKIYYVQSPLDSECTAEIVTPLFDQALGLHSLNQLILDELMEGFYNTKQLVTLKNMYAKATLEPSPVLGYRVTGSCPYAVNGIYSFISCPYNVCDKAPRSNYEANCITVDRRTGKVLHLDDLIDPQKRDSFENYIVYTAMRYHLRNVPSCYIVSYRNLELKGSNNMITRQDTVVYFKGLTPKFYLNGDKLSVYNKAAHRDYNYNSVEVSISLYYLRYFFRKEFLDRLSI